MAFDAPVRLRVLNALTDVLEAVTEDSNSATGYRNTLAGRVFRGRLFFGADDPVPCVSILEAPQPEEAIIETRRGPLSLYDWNLLIQGFAEPDRTNPTDPAYHLAADVVAALAAERDKARLHPSQASGPLLDPAQGLLGVIQNGKPVVDSISIGSPVIRPPDENSSQHSYFWLLLTIRIAENLRTPYL